MVEADYKEIGLSDEVSQAIYKKFKAISDTNLIEPILPLIEGKDKKLFYQHEMHLLKAVCLGILEEALPEDIKSLIKKNLSHNEGRCLLIRNLPVDTLLPDTKRKAEKEGIISELIIYGLCAMAGVMDSHPVSSIQSLYDNQPTEQPAIPHHVDGAPDHLQCILCLRGNKDAKTYFLPLEKVIPNLSPETLHELQKRQYQYHTEDERQAILEQRAGKYEINKRYNYINCVSEAGLKALSEFDAAIQQTAELHAQSFTLEKGDVLLLPNRKGTHAVSEFIVMSPNDIRWVNAYGGKAGTYIPYNDSLTIQTATRLLSSKTFAEMVKKAQKTAGVDERGQSL